MCCDSLHADVGSVQRICSRRGCNKHGNTRYCVCVWNHKLKRDSQGPTGCRVTSNQRSAALRCPCSTSLDHQFTCSLVLYLIFFSLRSDLSFHPPCVLLFVLPPSHTQTDVTPLCHTDLLRPRWEVSSSRSVTSHPVFYTPRSCELIKSPNSQEIQRRCDHASFQTFISSVEVVIEFIGGFDVWV